jgi:hypothetical protein
MTVTVNVCAQNDAKSDTICHSHEGVSAGSQAALLCMLSMSGCVL